MNFLQLPHKHIHKRLLYQLVIFILVSIVMFVIVGYDVFHGTIGFLLAIVGIGIGLLVGILAGRMFAIKWHEDTQKAVMNMDKTGIIIIVIYIAFRIFGEQIFGKFLHGETLTAFTFSMLGGITIGRFISLSGSIRNVLKQQNIL